MSRTTPRHLAGPQHRAESAKKRRLTGRELLASAAFIGGAAILGVTSTGSLALWNNSASIPDQSIVSGSFGIAVNDVTEYQFTAAELANLQKMLPGDVVQKHVTLKNIGHAKAAITATTTSTAALEVRLAAGPCAGTIQGSSSTSVPAALGTLAPNATQVVCVQVNLASTAAQGATAPFTITFAAIQER